MSDIRFLLEFTQLVVTCWFQGFRDWFLNLESGSILSNPVSKINRFLLPHHHSLQNVRNLKNHRKIKISNLKISPDKRTWYFKISQKIFLHQTQILAGLRLISEKNTLIFIVKIFKKKLEIQIFSEKRYQQAKIALIRLNLKKPIYLSKNTNFGKKSKISVKMVKFSKKFKITFFWNYFRNQLLLKML